MVGKDIGLEVNADKTKYMVMSRDQNAGRIHSMKSDNSSFERAEEFEYLGTILTNQNSIPEKLRSQGMLAIIRCRIFCSPKFKDLDIQYYRFAVVLYGCETLSLTLRDERRLRVFDNMVLTRNFVPKRVEEIGEWRKLHNEELNDLYSSPKIVRMIKSRSMGWEVHVAGMEKGKACTKFWWVNQR